MDPSADEFPCCSLNVEKEINHYIGIKTIYCYRGKTIQSQQYCIVVATYASTNQNVGGSVPADACQSILGQDDEPRFPPSTLIGV